jgi:hypothetical protein
MNYRETLDRIGRAITHQDLADHMGLDVQRIRQARLDPSNPGHRPPPDGWQRAVVELVGVRRSELLALKRTLERAG